LLEKHMTSVRLARALVAATLAGLSGLAVAQTWPAKPIRFIMTAGPGSSIDVIGRVLGERIQGPLGQPVVIDNRVGAGGTIATDAAAKAAPDGYTMVLSFNGPLSFGPHMYTKLPYDPFKDLAAVVLTTSQPNLLAVNAGLPVKSVRELIDYVRRNPGKLNYGSIGSGSSSHLTMELMKMQAGLFIVHIPYNGSPPAAASLAAADTQVLFTVPTALTPLIQAGKVRALAVSGLKRYSLERRPGSRRDTSPDHRSTQPRDEPRARERRCKTEAERGRARASRGDPGGIHAADPRGKRQVGTGHPEDRRKSGLTQET
jgi:tripartite-type tricarboxylate transporter receptor subunit TctC